MKLPPDTATPSLVQVTFVASSPTELQVTLNLTEYSDVRLNRIEVTLGLAESTEKHI